MLVNHRAIRSNAEDLSVTDTYLGINKENKTQGSGSPVDVGLESIPRCMDVHHAS